jgi:uncharacterized protein
VPHVYRLGHKPEFPALCLFDPKQDEWSPDEFIADKIIPWAIKWLFYYEVWLATGEWQGGGRHPEIPKDAACLSRDGSDLESRARRERSLTAAWPKDRHFRILSIDGGGIRGVFPAAILAGLERAYTGGNPVGAYFDLIAGTSTGGILALGFGAGFSAADLLDLYVKRGGEVFLPFSEHALGRLRAWVRDLRQYARYAYDRGALQRLLTDTLGDRLLGDSQRRLCIPAFEGRHSEVFVFKTPHHPDYQTDRHEPMVDVGLATAAAPTFFRPLEHNRYFLVDGGVWANNPAMLAVIEALTCFDIGRDQIDLLSLGCGDDPFVVSGAQIIKGGIWHWKKIMYAAMRLQSLAATNQARLLLGPPSVTRIEPPLFKPSIRMDDWRRSVAKLVPAAEQALAKSDQIAATFLGSPAEGNGIKALALPLHDRLRKRPGQLSPTPASSGRGPSGKGHSCGPAHTRRARSRMRHSN